MSGILQNYLPLVVFIGVAGLIGLVLLIAPFIVAFQQPDPEKLSAYECGFNAFDDARMKFDVRFYLVAILFIIFDLEVAFLFPWAVAFGKLGATGFWSMVVFLAVLTVGFAAAVRRHDRGGYFDEQDGACIAQGLRPDARAAICDLDGIVRQWRRLLSLFIFGGARLRPHRARRYLRARVPADGGSAALR